LVRRAFLDSTFCGGATLRRKEEVELARNYRPSAISLHCKSQQGAQQMRR